MFTAPLGLLALLGVPAVVVLHMYRRRLAERRVAGLFLFTGQRLVADAGRTRTRLLRTPSLWLECAAMLLLAMWLGGLSFGGTRPHHVVFVLDDSASMQVGGTRARVLAAVREQIAALASSDLVTVLRTGPRPEVLVGPRALPAEAAGGLPGWSPVQKRHDPTPALDLARELAAGQGEVRFCTDEQPPAGCEDVSVLAFGEAAPNCAIVTAERLPRPGGDEMLRLRIAGFGAVRTTQVAVFDGQRRLWYRALELHDGVADADLVLPAGLGAVRVQLDDDALALDNVAWLLPAAARPVAVCDLLDEPLRERLQLPRVFAALTGFRVEPESRSAQLVLATEPGQPVVGQTEVVVSAGAGERDAYAGPFVIDRAHPWLAGVELQGVTWLAGRRALPGQVLVAAGEQALLSEQLLEPGRRLWIDLDATAGNVPRSPDWPILFANLLDTCRAEVPGVVEPNVRLGDEAVYRRSMLAGGPDAQLTLQAPDGTGREGRGGRSVGFVLEQVGVHRLLGSHGEQLGQFAARFVDASESDLRGLCTASWPRTVAEDAAGQAAQRERGLAQRVLALLLLACVLADWWWLGRRGA